MNHLRAKRIGDKKAFAQADELSKLIFKRTGLNKNNLQCPREKSDMTPCIARDGKLAVCFDTSGTALCVGCETRVEYRLKLEKEKHV